MESPEREPDLPASVYWTVAVVAVLITALLAWFSAAWNVPLPEAAN